MAGMNPRYPIRPVELFDVPQDITRWGVEVAVNPASNDFPKSTLVGVAGTPPAAAEYNGTDPIAWSHEGSNDANGLNLEAGQQIFAQRKNSVYVIPVGDKRLVMTAGFSSGVDRPLDPADIGQSFAIAIDPASGFAYVDLDTPGGPATILSWHHVPGGPTPFDTTLPMDERVYARVVVELDPAACYAP